MSDEPPPLIDEDYALNETSLSPVKIYDVTGANLRQMGLAMQPTPPAAAPLLLPRELTIATILALRRGLRVTNPGYRSASWRSFLQRYLSDANYGSDALPVRACRLASRILGHDVFQDGNGRTAILAIYELFDRQGMALAVPPYLLWAAIASTENSESDYERNMRFLERVVTAKTVGKNDGGAVKLSWAISGVYRLQEMRANWGAALGSDSRSGYATGRSATAQADYRRMVQTQRFLQNLGKLLDLKRTV
jgi:prophage maintenance system killer protein